jgi:SecD/SecF fusion protein
MDKNAFWKWVLLAVLAFGSVWMAYPPAEKVKLGLDLAGGVSFTVQIDTNRLTEALLEELREERGAEQMPGPDELARLLAVRTRSARVQALTVIQNRVDRLGIAEPLIYPEGEDRIVVQIPGLAQKDRDQAERLVRQAAFLEFALVYENNDAHIARLFERGLAPKGYVRSDIIRQGRKIGPCYRRDYKALKIEQETDAWRREVEEFELPNRDARKYRFLLQRGQDEIGEYAMPYVVYRRSRLKGDMLRNVGVDYDQLNHPYITLRFNKRGAEKFKIITMENAPGGKNNERNERRYLAIIMDGRLYSAPYIKTAIYGGEAVIEGSFTQQEAEDLQIVLSTGSMPAPVTIVAVQSVDPTLGRDSVRQGFRATLLGTASVVAFMLVYYFRCGLIANTALAFNFILLPLGMILAGWLLSIFGGGGLGGKGALPVLTLPGIAGIALTMGMAVDANVLIFERIREELRAGKTVSTAVEAGYSRAFLAIFDSNLTTVFAAVVLFVFGSGPVRGFGVTLTAGILVSMYTALVLTRMIFNLLLRNPRIKPFRMLTILQDPKVDWVGWFVPATIVSLVVIVASLAIMGIRAHRDATSVLGIEFTGGASMSFQFDQRAPLADVRRALAAAGVTDARLQYSEHVSGAVAGGDAVEPDPAAGRGGTQLLRVWTASDREPAAREAVLKTFAPQGYRLYAEEKLEPVVAGEMLVRALEALGIALIVMILYIAWRFEFAFGVGAIVALFHDVLISAGLFSLVGRQLNMTIVGAMLAIIGYSINDTIVIFDRIRENMKLLKNRSFGDICNLSINQTLSRTILTSLTTLLVVLCLLLFGGSELFDFALIFFIGILAGTYSTVFIASPIMMWLHRPKKTE